MQIFTCLGKSQLALNREAQCILMFNFEKMPNKYQICKIMYIEKIKFLRAIFKLSGVIDTDVFSAVIAIASPLFPKNIASRVSNRFK